MNRIILVTGASSGYGKATAAAFVKTGDTVIMASRGEEKLRAAAKEVGGVPFVMDVTEPKDWENVRAFITEKYGRIDVLVNNAGGGIAIKDVAEQSVAEIDNAVKLNLNSVIYGCREFAPVFMAQKTGTVINISSVCAKECWPQWSVYAAAKAGVLNFSKGFYLEMQPFGVRVTTVIPSSASTGFQSAAGINETSDLLDASDIASTVLYVADLPQRAVVEDVTVWGIDKQVNPL